MSEAMASLSNSPALVPEEPACRADGDLFQTGNSSPASNAPADEAQGISAGSASTQNSKRKLNVYFMDPDGTAISNLSFRVDTPDACISGVSDMNGIGRVEVKEKAFFSLDVVRDDGSAETIYHGLMPSADANITAIAKSVKYSITTVLHEGTGTASAGGASSSGNKQKVKSTRDSNGHPVAVVQPRQKDQTMADIIDEGVKISFESSGNPVMAGSYWLYRLAQWTKSGPKKEIEIPPPTKDDGKAIHVEIKEGDQKKFETLMKFAVKQVTWNYKMGPKDVISSNLALERMMNKTKWKPEDYPKDASKSASLCLTYVKVAFNIAGITSILKTEGSGQAKDSAKDYLLPEKFIDVTKQCFYDPYVALPGDVIVYKRIKLGNADKKKYKKPEDHPGHIEIRTYDGFVSDYFSLRPIDSNFNKVIGIYRKVYDEKAQKRQDAFLKILRILETSNVKDRKEDYYLLNSPINGSKHFTNTSQHPWLGRTETPTGTRAAGAYQIILGTYEGYMDPKKVPSYPIPSKNFDPQSQTHFAIRIMAGWKKSLSMIRQGKIKEAIYTEKLNTQWVSLPGGSQCHLKGGFEEFIQIYQSFLQ